ncbi:hypothetical protein [Thermanaerothrix sp.]|jgi:16S rRNA (guanine(1405)-N(7))-methyltransferase|uniref:hypothetical protein n=1 Tax=Thermanaerothrix sp. TaxID=2972675 RepID=UPI002ADDF86D|nr:hypothetical protein [Thermanaerothrix sp.]
MKPLPEEQRWVAQFIQWARHSPKYRALDLPETLLADIITHALKRYPKPPQALTAARRVLHQVVAPYLGDPDYAQAFRDLEAAARQGEEAVRQVCWNLLQQHASTRERLPFMEAFYRRLFEVTGVPDAVLDLACGLNPLSWPWMGLPREARYLAFDIHYPRVQLIRRFFALMGIEGQAFHQDILVEPPQDRAGVAFFFKEIHRFEERQPGCARPFLRAIPARWLLISLPTRSLSQKRDLLPIHRRLMNRILDGLDWEVQEILFENEVVFCVKKDER